MPIDNKYLLVGAAGSIKMVGVVDTRGPRFTYRDRAESMGAIHDARLVKDNIHHLWKEIPIRTME